MSLQRPTPRTGIRQDGYISWINALVRELHLQAHVEWLGMLSASQIVRELQNAGAALIPTYIEGYCVWMAEAMRVGTPTVAAFTGGTSYLGRDEASSLFFPRGDVAMCTYQLERILTDRALAMRLSQESRAIAIQRNDLKRIVDRQVQIYKEILASWR